MIQKAVRQERNYNAKQRGEKKKKTVNKKQTTNGEILGLKKQKYQM